MEYYKNTTQVSNVLLDELLKTISFSELKILLTIIRKTIGMVHPVIEGKRIERVWISQRLFTLCCNLSGRAVSSAIDTLVKKQLIEVTNADGQLLHSKRKRRAASRLYFASRLRLVPNHKQPIKPVCDNPVNQGHTIKLNSKNKYCYNSSQGVKRLSDTERYQQILHNLKTKHYQDTN